ncbi:SPOR domain-containing protein, partial [Cypionkella sp.]|uniref:SPOR domain-containing protein n=1 Tax=Cypionkella sp. TaxID=2811411 RepID=UPI00260EC744
MADVDFDEFDGGYAERSAGPLTGRALTIVNIGGAVCSLALVIGLGVWGYKLAVRDVSGIPVVRALEGPLRIAPDNPGGDVAMHQGLSVNAVAAAGTALPLPDKLILAPKEVTLTDEDQAGMAELSALPKDAVAANAPAAAAPVGEIDLTPVEIAPVVAAEALPEETSIDGGSLAVTAPLPKTQEDAVAAALAAALADGGETDLAVTEPAALPAAMSVRPKTRPAAASAAPVAAVEPVAANAETPVEVPAEATDAPAAAATVAEIDPATIPAGTRLVQLGAFDDEASARAEWTRLQNDFPDLIPSKAMVVQSAQSGGRTF